MAIRRTQVTASPCAGGAGTSTATARTTHPIQGIIMAVYLDYLDSPPVTTDVTVAEATNSPAMPILTVTDAATAGWFQPLAQAESTAGAAFTGQAMGIAVNDYVSVTIAQANDGDGVTATIVYVEG